MVGSVAPVTGWVRWGLVEVSASYGVWRGVVSHHHLQRAAVSACPLLPHIHT